MPGKIARSNPRTPLKRPEMPGAVHTSHLGYNQFRKRLPFTPVQGSSGESRFKSAACSCSDLFRPPSKCRGNGEIDIGAARRRLKSRERARSIPSLRPNPLARELGLVCPLVTISSSNNMADL